MADIPVKTTLSNLIDYIWSSVLGTNSTITPKDATPKKATAIYMCYPGIPVDPSTLDDMLDYSNPNGSALPLEYFSNWMDKIPDLTQVMWSPTLEKVSGGYSSALGKANASPNAGHFSKKEKEKYDAADKLLWVTKSDDTQVHSDNYTRFIDARSKYDTVVTNYNMTRNKYDMSIPKEQKEWLAVSPGLKRSIDNAWDGWVAAHKNDIENALAIMGSTLRNGIGTAIKQQQTLFDRAFISPLIPGGADWYSVFTFPTQWWKAEAPGWMKIEIKSDMSYAHMEEHSKNFSADLELFSFKANGGYSAERKNETNTSENVSISMEIAVIDLIREWLNVDWMKSSDWYEDNEYAEIVSSGFIDDNNNEMYLPSIPNRLIAARNIVMSGDWSETTSDEFKQKIDAKTSFGYGPFTIRGSYEQGDEDKTMTSQFDGTKLTIDGMQIIGFMAACAPKAASMDDPDKE